MRLVLGLCLGLVLPIEAFRACAQESASPATQNQDSDSTAASAHTHASSLQKGLPVEITADGETNFEGTLATASGNVVVRYGADLLYADQVTYDSSTRTATADGNVRIYAGTKLYRGDHAVYNFETQAVTSVNFALATFPTFSKGESVATPGPDHYRITNGYLTTDNREHPSYRLRAHTIEIYPDDRVVLKDVVLYVGDVPVFWIPIYYQSLKDQDSTFTLQGGSTSRFGFTTRATLNWRVSDDLAATFHEDYRSKRGDGGGVDLKYTPVPGGSGIFRSYYTRDSDFMENPTALPRTPISTDRYLFSLQQIMPLGDSLDVKVNANVWSDPYITEDFFPHSFSEERMPDNTIEAVSRGNDLEVSLLGRVQANRFFDTTERAPELRIENKPIKLFDTPIEYESETSIVNFRQQYSDQQYSFPTLPKNFSAYRWDTYHELLYPKQYFGWLSLTPHFGLRGTAWSHDNLTASPTSTTDANGPSLQRGVVDFGQDISFKLSRSWLDYQNKDLAIDGVRHVFEPFVNFEAVLPSSNRNDLQGFDTRLPNTWANPIDFPLYNSIDSIDRQFVVRQGVHNEIQTKRDGKNWNLVDWSIFSDLNLTGHYDEEQVFNHDSYSHVYSDATIRPFTWMHFDSKAALDVNGDSYDMIDHSITWQPDRSYQLTFGDRLLQGLAPTVVDSFGDPIPNSNVIYLRNFYRLNEHWQFETLHQFNSQDSTLEEQSYTIYRDLSAWQISMTYQEENNRERASDQSIYFTLTLKAFPAAMARFSE